MQRLRIHRAEVIELDMLPAARQSEVGWLGSRFKLLNTRVAPERELQCGAYLIHAARTQLRNSSAQRLL
jgi:hypothetical protein